MKFGQTVVVIGLTAALTLLVSEWWRQAPAPAQAQETAAKPAPRPYQVVSASFKSTDYEMIYILDNEARRLAAFKYDRTQGKFVPVGGRELAKDFGVADSGGYSMATLQLDNQTGLLCVTDYGARRAIVYTVDLIHNKVTPQEPVDLKAIFGN